MAHRKSAIVPNLDDMPPIVDIGYVANLFRVSVETIRLWRTKLGMPYITIGGTVRFDRESLKKWLKENERNTP